MTLSKLTQYYTTEVKLAIKLAIKLTVSTARLLNVTGSTTSGAFGRNYKPRFPAGTRMRKDHIRTLKIL